MSLLRRRSAPVPPPAAEQPRSWELGDGLSDEHRERLLRLGLPSDALEALDLRRVERPLPRWWHENHNAFYVTADLPFSPARRRDLKRIHVQDSLVVLGADVDHTACARLHGDGATLFIGQGCHLPGMEINCGGGSAIILSRRVTATGRGSLDARNGGLVLAHPDQLWASDVIVSTDDMHRLEDAATGARLNGFGGRIELGQHVWIGRDAVITGSVTLGDDCVVGMRSLVRNKTFAAGTAVAGIPARAIRDGVTWTRADTP